MARHAVKLLLIDADDQLLLIHSKDPRTDAECWYPVGGGVEMGESFQDAAAREAYEETGMTVLPPGHHVWRRDHTYEFNGRVFEVHEDWLLHRIEHFEPAPAELSDDEARSILGFRWWVRSWTSRPTPSFRPGSASWCETCSLTGYSLSRLTSPRTDLPADRPSGRGTLAQSDGPSYRHVVIVWLNGTFGVGKTTISGYLAAGDDRLRHFDPEWVGYMLANNLSDHAVTDFQQYPSWRRLVPVVADEIARFTGQHLVAAQSVLVEDYWREIATGLADLGHEVFHVLLDADVETLHDRIDSDEQEPAHIRPWRHRHVEIFESARDWLRPTADLVVDTVTNNAVEASQQIRTAIDARV